MQTRLDDYLAEVSAHLAVLPTVRRNEELKEMRQHLLDAIVINREMGQNENEATRTALEQFGSPEQVVSGVIQAWKRDNLLKRRDFVGATICTFVMPSLLLLLITPLISPFVLHGDQSYRIEWNLIYNLAIFGMSGLMSGFAFPRRGVAGVVMAVLILIVALILQILMIVQHAAPAARLSLLAANIDFFVSWKAGLNLLARAFVAALAAWIGSRWRKMQNSRIIVSQA